jgi:hypothetical protein
MLFAFFLTSLKFGRFWGEANRYLEVIAPISIVYSVSLLEEYTNFFVLYFFILLVIQFLITFKISKSLKDNESIFEGFDRNIQSLGIKDILLFSNNHHASKYFLSKPWNFILIWSFEEEIVGTKAPNVFSKFPRIKFKSFLKIIDEHKPNIILLEKLDDVVEEEMVSRGFSYVFTSNNFVLYTKE